MKSINIKERFLAVKKYWSPEVIALLNDHDIRIALIQGEYHWHQHLQSDELFLVIEGELRIDFREQSVSVREGEFLVVPKGIEHKPYANNPCKILLIEAADTIPTGDVSEEGFR